MTQRAYQPGPGETRRRIAVVVLGELAQSPRMRYHARALAARPGVEVHVLSHDGAGGANDVGTGHRIGAPGHAGRHEGPRARFAMHAFKRMICEAGALARALLGLGQLDAILVQCPPALPTLPVALAVARLRGARLVVDWHNFGAAVLALHLGARHPAVQAARHVERLAGARADAHLCVSLAMQRELAAGWGIPGAIVLRDHPAEAFTPLGPEDAAAALDALAPALGLPAGFASGPRRPLVIASGTSFTADEDLALLLEAIALLERGPAGDRPRFVVIVTGRGPRRAAFEAALARLPGRVVKVYTAFLPERDYARLLGAADLGLCLHRSASGVDLPMKVADMLGAGLPVCALDYGPCLREQLPDADPAAVFFRDATELTARLRELAQGHPGEQLARMQRAARGRPLVRWADAWALLAAPVLLQ